MTINAITVNIPEKKNQAITVSLPFSAYPAINPSDAASVVTATTRYVGWPQLNDAQSEANETDPQMKPKRTTNVAISASWPNTALNPARNLENASRTDRIAVHCRIWAREN